MWYIAEFVIWHHNVCNSRKCILWLMMLNNSKKSTQRQIGNHPKVCFTATTIVWPISPQCCGSNKDQWFAEQKNDWFLYEMQHWAEMDQLAECSQSHPMNYSGVWNCNKYGKFLWEVALLKQNIWKEILNRIHWKSWYEIYKCFSASLKCVNCLFQITYVNF